MRLLFALLILLTPALACGKVPWSLYEKTVRTAQAFGLPPHLLVTLVWVESRFCPQAVSPKGAVGLGQVMPDTARAMGIHPARLTHADWNLYASARYLRQQYLRFGDWRRALYAYNAGPGRAYDPPAVSVRYAQDVLGLYARMEQSPAYQRSLRKVIAP